MRTKWMGWTLGILLVVGFFVTGCMETKNEEGTTRGTGESMTQAPRQDGTPSAEPVQPNAAGEQMPEQQKEKQPELPGRG
jgi:hypothetical protein